jgi:uncharacterized protein YjbI with pentapeptide repeats
VPFRYIVHQDTGVTSRGAAKYPRLPRHPRDDLAEADALLLDDDGELTRTRVIGGRHAGFSFAGARLTDVELVRCDLAGCDFSETKLTRVVVVDCRATAIEAGQAQLRDVAIVDSVLRDANFRLTTLENVRFESSTLVGAEFIGARLENVAFTTTDLSRADFTQARCTAVDMRDARLDDVKGVGSLAGASISLDQAFGLAPALAVALGIAIAPPDDAPVQSPPSGGTGGV